MAAAVLAPPHLPLGPTLMGGGQEAASHLSDEWKSPDDYRRELMIEYALAEYSYVITEDEADEIFANPHWWEDVDAFVEYMQEVNSFGTSIAGTTTNVALASTLRVYSDAELDAMEETGDFYPPTPTLSHGDDSSLELDEEEEEEPLPLYELRQQASGESLPAKCPPTYMESVDAIFAALGQELEMLGLVQHDNDNHDEQQQQPQQPEEVLEVEKESEDDEPEDEQLDTLSRWLASLTTVPTTPRASIEVAAEAEVADVSECEIVDADAQPPCPPSPVVLAIHEAVPVSMAAATPALVVVAASSRPKRSPSSLLPIIAPPAATTRRERFGRRVRKVTSTLSRGLNAIFSYSSSK